MNTATGDNSRRDPPANRHPPVGHNLPGPILNFIDVARRGDIPTAVQHLLDERVHSLLPHGKTCTRWLVQEIGIETTRRILQALAHYPCFYCRRGCITCETCEGHGHWPEEPLCGDCGALGVRPCEFCGGSGWLALDSIPPGLRFAIHRDRTRTALDRAARLISEFSAPSSSAGADNGDYRKGLRDLLHIHRLLAMFDNSLAAEKEGVFDATHEALEAAQRRKVLVEGRSLCVLEREAVGRLVGPCKRHMDRHKQTSSEWAVWQARFRHFQSQLGCKNQQICLLLPHAALESALDNLTGM